MTVTGYSTKMPFATHKVHKFVCKCEKSNQTSHLQNNTSVNSTVLGNVGFETEEVIVRNGEKMKRAGVNILQKSINSSGTRFLDNRNFTGFVCVNFGFI